MTDFTAFEMGESSRFFPTELTLSYKDGKEVTYILEPHILVPEENEIPQVEDYFLLKYLSIQKIVENQMNEPTEEEEYETRREGEEANKRK